MTRTATLLAGGAVSGGIWFLVALALDKGVKDLNVPVIPTSSLSEIVCSLLAAVATGVGVTFAFRKAWVSRSRIVLGTVPLAALATAVLAFSVLAWVLNQTISATTYSPAEIASTLFLYAMLSAFTPILYLLALVNGLAIRRMLCRAA